MSSPHDDGGEGPRPAQADPPGEAQPVEREGEVDTLSPGYAPPPSPAYAPPRPTVIHTGSASTALTYTPRADGGRGGPPVEVPVATDQARRSAQRAWFLLATGLALVAAVGWVVVVQSGASGAGDAYVFGEVVSASEGARVRSGDSGDEVPLAPGDQVVAGSVIEATGNAAVAVDLAGGGSMRFDSGARIVFVDTAVDPETGEVDGASQPAVHFGGGRLWLDPPDGPTAIEVQVPGGTVAGEGNPVALDCSPVCTIEAPAGGVTVTTRTDNEVAPAPGELVTITSGHGFEAQISDGPSRWAAENLAADRDAGLPPAPLDDAPGIAESASFTGTYVVTLQVVGPPSGDAIPEPLRYPEGTTYSVTLVADASRCTGLPCALPVTGTDGGGGSAEVVGGGVRLAFEQAIDCYDETDTTVVVPGVGATTVRAELDVTAVGYEGGSWIIRTVAGTGQVSASLTKRCNGRDVLGTSESAIEVTGTRS